jgi:hypothetical protein
VGYIQANVGIQVVLAAVHVYRGGGKGYVYYGYYKIDRNKQSKITVHETDILSAFCELESQLHCLPERKQGQIFESFQFTNMGE